MKSGSDLYIVYKHTCPNGKVYIGVTKQKPNARWKNGAGYKYNEHFTNAINKYGWDNITHEILFSNLNAVDAEEMEISLIAKFKSDKKEFGYNNSPGGLGGAIGESGRLKLSLSMKKQYADGVRLRERSVDSRQKTSETLKRRFSAGEIVRVITPEQRVKISVAHSGNKLTDEHKAKINAAAHKKAVVQYNNDGVIAVYDGVRIAGRETGIDYTCIIKVLKGKKHTAGGYLWKYAE